jgi:Cytochrome P460
MSRAWWLACAGVLGTAAVMAAGSSRSAPEHAAVPFPEGFREWVHIKSGMIDDPAHPAFARFGGLHHIYANPAAMQGFRDGRFPDGAVLVYDLHALAKLPDGSTDQAERRHVDVMVKDIGRFASTGGWGYEEFTAETRTPTLSPTARAGCAACHATRKSSDGVFSDYRK